MKKVILATAVSALLLALTAGVAIAVTKTCTSDPCNGTNRPDTLFERAGNAVNDTISGRAEDDVIDANNFTSDTDVVSGNGGNDKLFVNDNDSNDTANGGRGIDTCVVDDVSEVGSGCNRVRIR